ncbi:MAG: hypothetical protein KBT67_08090 [bacterium]|nr:hypothetical protein [Candidatus Limimorpha caballi]
MILLFEEYQYTNADDIALIKQCVDQAYLTETASGVKAGCVGYFYCTNPKVNDVVFVLPKVFIKEDGTAFGKYKPEEIIKLDSLSDKSLNDEKETVFELSAWLYQAIAHFVERNPETEIVRMSDVQEVASSKGEKCETYLDIILQLQKFQKEHRHLFTFISIVNRIGSHKINWNKTVRKVQPFLQDGTPVYMDFYNKTKSINFDEELIVLFYSTLRFLQEKMRFKTVCDLCYDLIPMRKIESMIAQGHGTRRLRAIRKKYFTDELVKLWNLLYVFFEKAEKIASGKYHEEKLLAVKFNIIFEDMIDQLIGGNEGNDDLLRLKHQKDGKRLDHLYKESSLINNGGEIYFIGDSKYYKESTDLGETAVYKQFTYAKNIIQYHIDIFNENKQYPDELQYRDELTEGYNITPNFFIRASAIKKDNSLYGYTEDGLKNEYDDDVKDKQNKLVNYHFPNRLFDRDTFVLQTYNINFLYVLAHYVQGADKGIQQSIRDKFREDLISRFNKLYDFWIMAPKSKDIQSAVDKHFRKILGKVFRPYQNENDNLLILALEKLSAEELKDESKREKHDVETIELLKELQEDFIVRPHRLGEEPSMYHLQFVRPYSFENEKEKFNELFQAAESPAVYGKQRIYLVGCYKSKEHYNWIKNNKLYNVRLGERRGAVNENDSFVVCATHLVLYNFDNPEEFEVWRLKDEPKVSDKEKMESLDYPNPKGEKYLLYGLKGDPVEMEIDLPKFLKDKKVQKGSQLEGAPVYVTGGSLF